MSARKVAPANWLSEHPALWPVLGLLVLFAFNFFFAQGFFRIKMLDGRLYGTLIDILNQGSKVMLLSIGMTLVIATGGVDLSVGSIMAISGAVAAVLVKQGNWPFALVLIIPLLASIAAGLWNGMLVAARIQPIIATLILMVAGRGIAMLLSEGQIVTFDDPRFTFIGNGHLLALPFTVTIVAIVLALTSLAARKTPIGLFIEAVGDNETAARFCGISTGVVKLLVYAFSGLCAGLAGLIDASKINAADSAVVGKMMELDAIFAVVVGGTALTGGRFTLIGSVVGAILIQTLTTTMYQLGVPSDIAPVPKAIVIIGVCLIQSRRFRGQIVGIFSRPKRRALSPPQPAAG